MAQRLTNRDLRLLVGAAAVILVATPLLLWVRHATPPAHEFLAPESSENDAVPQSGQGGSTEPSDETALTDAVPDKDRRRGDLNEERDSPSETLPGRGAAEDDAPVLR